MSVEGSIAAVGIAVLTLGVLLSVRAANARKRVPIDGAHGAVPRTTADRAALVLMASGACVLAVGGLVLLLKGVTALAAF